MTNLASLHLNLDKLIGCNPPHAANTHENKMIQSKLENEVNSVSFNI